MKIILTSVLIVLQITVFAQYQHWEWAKSFGGTGNDSAVDMKIKNGFLYVTGKFTSPQINWEGHILTNNGGQDIFVAKMDTLGNTIWVKNFGGTGNDTVLQLEINNNGTSVLRCTSGSGGITVGGSTLTNPKDFYIELDAAGAVLIANKLLPNIVYEDIDIDPNGGVYLGGGYRHSYSFAGQLPDTAHSKAGGVVFKYGNDGTEQWSKYIPVFYDVFDPNSPNNGLSTGSMRLEYCSIDTSIAFLCTAYGGHLSLSPIGYTSDPVTYIPGAASPSFSSGKLSLNNGNLTYFTLGEYPSGGSLPSYVNDFEFGNNGLRFSGFNWSSLNSANYYITKDYNRTRNDTFQMSISNFGSNVDSYPFNLYTRDVFKTNESGNYLLINNNPVRLSNNLEVLDTNLNRIIKVSIPPFDNQYMSWFSKCMADTNAIYFADSYSNSSVLLNAGIAGATPIQITNTGTSAIFIGKYAIFETPLFKLDNLQSVYKVCSTGLMDTIQLNLTIDSLNAIAPFSYHWQVSSHFSDTTILNPKVYLDTDSVVNILTVTDANGRNVSKQFVFYKLPTSRTAINVSLCPGRSYTFPDGTIQSNIIANTSHISRFVSSNGCDSIVVISISMTVSAVDTSITKAGLILNSNSTLSTYQWLDCAAGTPLASATQQSYTVTTPGSYAVEITKGGCADTSSCYTITNDNIAAGGRLLNLFPVPVRDILTIVVQSDRPAELYLSISDFSGTIIKSERLNIIAGANNIIQNIGSLAAGVYTLKLIKGYNNEIIIKRIVKN